MAQENFDIVIVGSGAAGSVIADYLARKTEATIAVIEAGDNDSDPMIHIPAGYSNILAHDRHVWTYDLSLIHI